MEKSTIEPKDIVLETALLKTMAKKENYTLYIHSVDKKRLLPATSLLLTDYGRYFELFPEHDNIDLGQFQTQFTQNWHQKDLDQLDIDFYNAYVFPAVAKCEGADIERCLLGLMHKQTSEELSQITANNFDLAKLRNTLDEYERKQSAIISGSDSEVFTMHNVDFTPLDKACGIPYFLPTLQSGLGSLVKGQFVVVSADYGTGKTAFVISQAVETLRHLTKTKDPRPVLYFNSEGTEGDVFGRFLSNLYSSSHTGGFEEIVANAEAVRTEYLKKYNAEQFMVFQISSGGVGYIKQKVAKYNPALVIIDITDVLAPEEDVLHLKKIFDQLRLLSGTSCPIIGTTQSGDTSWFDKETGQTKTKKWLGDKALYGSKTGKGGAADTIITIGKDDQNPKLRYVSTPKKKRGVMVNLTCILEDNYSLYKELTF